jgi:phosphoserine phosphatase
MPTTSKKQHNFMAAVANNPKFAKKVGVPKSVGAEFMKADKGRKFKEGGALKQTDAESNPGLAKLPTEVRNKMGYMKKGGMAHSDMAKDKPMMKKVAKEEVKKHEKSMHKMAKGGVTRADGCVSKGHTKGKMVAMKKGGAC